MSTGDQVALDTSVAVPLLMRRHEAHAIVRSRLRNLALRLTAHSQVETYSVLTRLPGDARVLPGDAARLLLAFAPGGPLVLDRSAMTSWPARFAELGISGGATYDAIVALEARANDALLLTRDARAVGTYQRMGVRFEVVDG